MQKGNITALYEWLSRNDELKGESDLLLFGLKGRDNKLQIEHVFGTIMQEEENKGK